MELDVEVAVREGLGEGGVELFGLFGEVEQVMGLSEWGKCLDDEGMKFMSGCFYDLRDMKWISLGKKYKF